jgi:cytochrome c oxidase subunit 3/cytochrome o ubiquinol oxidase subunit 3
VAAVTTPEHHSTPYSNNKIAMWAFLGSECLFFGALISSYLLYKNRGIGGQGPFPKDLFDIPFTSATSFFLLVSSLSMVLALNAIQRGDPQRMRVWLMCTAALGLLFVSCQVFEFTEFIREGMHPTTNVPATSFFVLTGVHGAHVTIGVLMLLGLAGASLHEERQGRRWSHRQSERIEIFGLYWHFVDIVWIIIFTVIYLIR